MSEDKKLRCAVVYRLEGDGPSAIPLCSFDHAAAKAGSRAGEQQGKFAKAVARVIGADPPTGVAKGAKVGGFRVVQSDEHQIVYGADPDGLCFCVITGLAYPNRIAIQFLEELAGEFKAGHGSQAMKAKENGLNIKAKKVLTAMCSKYETAAKVDSALRVIDAVDGVKGQMQDNITGMLKNQESAESLNAKSQELSEQASVFKTNSKQLKNTMRWKNLKMTLMLGGVVLIVGLIILLSIWSQIGFLFKGSSSSKSESSKSDGGGRFLYGLLFDDETAETDEDLFSG